MKQAWVYRLPGSMTLTYLFCDFGQPFTIYGFQFSF